jgi:hypothetical protein
MNNNSIFPLFLIPYQESTTLIFYNCLDPRSSIRMIIFECIPGNYIEAISEKAKLLILYLAKIQREIFISCNNKGKSLLSIKWNDEFVSNEDMISSTSRCSNWNNEGGISS